MNRRELLASTVGTTALVGCLDSGPDDSDSGDGNGGAPEPPFEIATIDAPGSSAGTVSVPQSERPMLLNFTRTQCPTSRAHLSTLAEAKATLAEAGYAVDGDAPAIRFLSIVDGTRGPAPSDAELRTWFDENGGNWPLGRDRAGTCNDFYEISGFPTTMTIDATGEVGWRNRSGTSPGTVVDAVESAIEAGRSDRQTGDGNETASETLLERAL